MRIRPPVPIAAFAALAALVCAPSARASWPHDPTLNLHVAPSSYSQYFPKVASDGSGGFFLVWQQQSASTGWDIYAQHVTANGEPAAGWAAEGIALYAGGNDQTNPAVMSDGVGGAYFAWEDRRASASSADIYVGRLTGDGNIPSGWIAGGVAAQFDAKDEYAPILASDGVGGMFIVWSYVYAAGDIDIYGARFGVNGSKAWSSSLVAPGLNQSSPAVVEDGAGGICVAYNDSTGSGLDVRAARFFGNGVQAFNISVRAGAADQINSGIATDGEGGAIVAYQDRITLAPHIYASRITSTGAFATGWSTSGTAVCTAPVGQLAAAIVSDGAHGAIIGWLDARNGNFDIYAARLGPYGALAPGWVVDGNAISLATGIKNGPAIAPDGSGGATFAWSDARGGATSIYASRLTSAGTLPPGWAFDGVPVRTAPGICPYQVIAFDGTSAACMAWRDDRGSAPQVYAQRMDRFGVLGRPEPMITAVKDLAHDQGGKVGVVWNGSWLDSDPLYGVAVYWMWRQVPLSLAQAAVARGSAWLDENAAEAVATLSTIRLPSTALDARAEGGKDIADLASHGLYLLDASATAGYAWEFIAQLAASGFPAYSFVAPTTSDSVAAGNPRMAFMVQARGAAFGAYWNSAPDSGYSVDNLPPAVPAPFTGEYMSGTSALHWGPNLEADLANYRLYRGSSVSFVPGSGNRVASPADTGYVDNAGAPYYYKLSAVDIHGNESGFALLNPSGILDGPAPSPPHDLALRAPQPNPVATSCVIPFDLPREADVTIDVFDVAGRSVRQLQRGTLPPGAHTVQWDARDGRGNAVGGGIYFVRMSAERRTFRSRVLVTR